MGSVKLLIYIPTTLLRSCVAWGKFPKLSGPPVLTCENVETISTYLKGLLWR